LGTWESTNPNPAKKNLDPLMNAELRDHAAAFVLAGGQSSRMGRDKALLTLAGQPLIAHALATLREAGLPAAIAGSRSDLASFAPVLPDSKPGKQDSGPLAGICAALASTSARYVVFLSVDLPLLPSALLVYLLHHARITASAVTIPSVNGRAQTFPAVLDRDVLPFLEGELAARRLGCLAAFQSAAAALGRPFRPVPVEYLVQAGQVAHPTSLPAAHWFLNLNTPADLERAECLRQIRARSIA
jgi:molybdopterin-guanine dinucleotide biosynthesis protein A